MQHYGRTVIIVAAEMSPNYRDKPPDADVVPDWLLGGNRKRRVLEALALRRPKRGWSVAELVDEGICAQTTAYEILRALKPLGLLAPRAGGRVSLSEEGELATSLRALLDSLQSHRHRAVDRPHRRRGPT
jgi:hypothetical protein